MESALRSYLRRVREIRASGAATDETSYYGALEGLLNAVGETLEPAVHAVVALRDRGAGRPDLGIVDRASGDLRGVIEAKSTTDDSLRTARGEQVTRYWGEYGLVLVTSYRDFVVVGTDEHGEPEIAFRYSLAASEEEFWTAPIEGLVRTHAGPFLDFLAIAVTLETPLESPQAVADTLARYARVALVGLTRQEADSVAPLKEAIERALDLRFSEKDGEHFFRSTLVQTLFYGLFSAWILWLEENGEEFDWRLAAHYLRIPLLSALFEEVVRPTRLRQLGLEGPIKWAARALNRTQPEPFLEAFQERRAIQYFYEPFLQAFDPELRKALGIWYTPTEIVRYQIRQIDYLLREKLGLADGIADEQVYLLDPCCGTGSYLVEAIAVLRERLEARGAGAALGDLVKDAVKRRIIGFEVLPAPFVIAHLQLGLLLRLMGTELADDERAAVFLTNALADWQPGEERLQIPVFPELEEEREAAEDAKWRAPILVIVGNPPYNRYAGVATGEEAELIAPYKEDLYERYGVRKQLLDDLYIRFYRLGERQIAEARERGIVSFISNYSWLDGVSHPVMREHLLTRFDEIWIDNLNGDAFRSERAPDGRPDESVFKTPSNPGIRVGTAISFLIKRQPGTRSPRARVFYSEHWGPADEKRRTLLDRRGGDYMELEAKQENRWAFVPLAAVPHYESWTPFHELFPIHFSGVNENRGSALIALDREPLAQQMRDYFNRELSSQELGRRYPELVRRRARYDPDRTRSLLLSESGFQEDRLVRLAYRPLDDRWLYWEPLGKLLNESRNEFMDQVFPGNWFLSGSQTGRRGGFNVPIITSKFGDLHLQDPWSQFFPLWVRYSEDVVVPNVSVEVLRRLCEIQGVEVRDTNNHFTDEAKTLAELVFFHTLAVVHSEEYQAENDSRLQNDWPRIPIPRQHDTLEKSADLGRQIAHLLDPDFHVPGVTTGIIREELVALAVPTRVDGGGLTGADYAVTIKYTGAGRYVERGYHTEEIPLDAIAARFGERTGDVYWNELAFWKNVPSEVYAYRLGGYPVLKKWLSYRHADKLGRPLRADEVMYFQEMTRRICDLLLLAPKLEENYRHVKEVEL